MNLFTAFTLDELPITTETVKEDLLDILNTNTFTSIVDILDLIPIYEKDLLDVIYDNRETFIIDIEEKGNKLIELVKLK